MHAKKYSMEFLVGIFVLIGLLCVGYLTIRLGKMELFSNNGYTLVAKFSSTTGLRSGANVEIAGVSVGKVAKIELVRFKGDYYSNVHLRIRKGIEISGDTIVGIKTSGLIGDKFVNLVPGGAEDDLEDGGELTDTRSSIDIEDLISKYVFGSVQ